jgi:hypothetical protein
VHLDRFSGPQEPPKLLLVGRVVLNLCPDRFFIDFSSIFAGMWDNFWSQKIKQNISKSDVFWMRVFDVFRRVSASL